MFGWIITGGLLLRERAQEIESGYRKEDTPKSSPSWWEGGIIAFGAIAFIGALIR